MRIGIITLPFGTNYGGILQNYALNKVLRKLGHEAYTVRLEEPILPLSRRLKNRIKEVITSKRNGDLISEIKSYAKIDEPFLEKYITRTSFYVNNKSFKEKNIWDKFDALIVGSDQVWRKPYIQYYLDVMFLRFVNGANVIKLSYAASWGVDNTKEYKFIEKKKLYKDLHDFKAISVRESTGVDICKNEFGVNAICVADPTLLLDKDDYPKTASVYNRDKCFVYLLNHIDGLDETINEICENYGMERLNVTSFDSRQYGLNNYECPTIEEWIGGISNSQVVVTDSYHGTIFCIIFNKQFLVMGNVSRGNTRFETLLSRLGLQNRMVNDIKEIPSKLFQPIDWEPVNKRKEQLKTIGLEFLTNNLKK